MRKLLLIFLLALVPALVGAAPIVFLSTQYSTSAVGIAGVAFDAADGQSPPSSLPLTSFAIADDGAGLGAAAALADVGVLVAQAEALGSDEGATGSASAEFGATFLAPGGPIALTFDFTAEALVEDAGFASSLLRVLLLADATTVFDQLYATPGAVQALIDLPAGALGTLSLQLLAAAGASGPLALGSAGGAVTFAALAVPEPGSAMLVLMAGVSMLLVVRRRSIG